VKYDRETKFGLYARARIADYWIVNIIDRQVEVYRDPSRDSKTKFGFSYSRKTIHRSGDFIKALAFDGLIAVADLIW
jgi:Uma2 family endonuclease